MADLKISALTAHTTPIDTDVVPIVDVTTAETKKITWAGIKATLKTYFDTLYTAIIALVSGDYSVSSDGCILYHPLNASSILHATDVSQDKNPNNTYNGALTTFVRKNGTPTAVVITSGALVFNGTTSVIDVGDTTYATVKSIFFRIKATDATSQSIIDLDAGTHTITTDANDDVAAGGFATPTIYVDGAVGTRITNGTWHSVCITTATGVDVDNLDIGKIAAAFFAGSLNDIQFYTETLTAGEVLAQHNAGLGQYALKGLGLVLQYSGRDFAGTTAVPTTIYDTNMIVKGEFEEALNFPLVTGRYVSIGANSDFIFNTGDWFSFSCKFQLNALGIYQQLINKRTGTTGKCNYNVYILNSNRIEFRFRNSANNAFISYTPANTLLADTPYTLQVKHLYGDDSKIKMFLNGVELTATWSGDGNTAPMTAAIAPMTLGERGDGADMLNGRLSNVLLFNRDVTDEEFLAIYNRQKTYFTDNNPAGRLGDFGIKGDLKVIGNIENSILYNLPEGTMYNGKIVPSVASNNLTVALKGMDGNDPSATNPVYIRIAGVIRTITSALSVTKNAATNWCNAGSSELASKEIDYFVYLGYNATDGVVIGFSRIPYAALYSDFSTTTTAEKYCAISTIANAAAGDNYVNIGRFAATLSAGAGYTWTVPTFTANNLIQRPIYETRWLTYLSTVTWTAGTAPSGSPIITERYKIRGNLCLVDVSRYNYTAGATVTACTVTMPILKSVGVNLSCVISAGITTPNLTIGYIGSTAFTLTCASVSATFLSIDAEYPL